MTPSSFAKIFALGTRPVLDIFKGEVEITEKIDGSQFCVGKIDGKLFMRSKGCVINAEDFDTIQSLFKPVAKYFISIQNSLPNNILFYGETLAKPKHNTLVYDRVPKNHFCMFGVYSLVEDKFGRYEHIDDFARILEVDAAPLLFRGKWASETTISSVLTDLLNNTSYLGGAKIEGVVIKNYSRQACVANDLYTPIMCAKYVSESFKEVHRGRWKDEETKKGKWQTFCEGYRTPARWEKAVIHLQERGELTNSPQDIGKLLKEINMDIESEERDIIKDFLWNEFKKELLHTAAKGFPEWYKQKLVENY